MRLSKSQMWISGTALVCALIVLAGWFLLIAPQRAEAADLRDQTASANQANAQLEARIAQLKADFAELPTRKAELAAIRLAMPEEPQLAALTRDVESLSTTSGVTLMSVTPGAVSPAVAPVAPATPAADPADPDAAAAAAATPAPTSGLSEMTFEIVVVGSFASSETFLEGLQQDLDRRFLVDGITVIAEKPASAANGKPAVGNGDVTFTVTGRVFVLAADAAPAAAPAPTDAVATN